MSRYRARFSGGLLVALGVTLTAGLAVAPVGAHHASAADAIVELGTAGSFAVLGGTAVTDAGSTVISGDLGVNPGTSITGILPSAVSNGTVHATDAVAVTAQSDLTAAYVDAARRAPLTSGLTELGGKKLIPGVYSGGALTLTGTLELAGDANSVFIFQAASELVTASNSNVILTGGATACNVFWQVTSSATLGTDSTFVGTVMALASITAQTDATIEGRLLARNGAVTLDSNVITRPTSCGTTDSGTGDGTGGTGGGTGDGTDDGTGGGTGDASGGTGSGTGGTGTGGTGAEIGAGSGAGGAESVVTATDAAQPTLAATGANPLGALLLAFILIAGGALLTIRHRGNVRSSIRNGIRRA
jgi:hypothetical protein